MREPEIKVLTKRERKQIAQLKQRLKRLQNGLAKLKPDHGSNAEEMKKQIAALTKQRDAIQKNARLTMITVSIKPRPIRILPRGDWLDDSGPTGEPLRN